MTNKIKVNAPSSNPHICYVPSEYKEKIEIIKQRKGMSFYRILCLYAGIDLDSKDNIAKFKKKIKKQGFKTIGDWAVAIIEQILDEGVCV